jgi:MFS family permease
MPWPIMHPIPTSPRILFWGCWIALVTTSFGFLLRVLLMDDWARQFHLTETQKGELFGVGLWPFAISIVVFSLVIDRIGYKTAMLFGFACHLASLLMTVNATSYEGLYWANFVVALGNGTVEAYINPVVATQFREQKTVWLNRLHAGWPAGFVIAGLLALLLGSDWSWQSRMWLLLAPALTYAAILLFQEFPVNERVAAGVPYRAMLAEVGAVGAFLITWLVAAELLRSLALGANPLLHGAVAAAVVAAGVFAAVRTLGRPFFILMLLVMLPLATTELGVDSWVSDLLGPVLGGKGIWVLLYTASLMMVLRFCAGAVVHRLSPLGLLALCSAVAAAGLVALSSAAGAVAVFAAATLYAAGKAFFWPTMLGVVAEQCPRGGALTLNATGGVGMLGVGVLGAMLLGNIQDRGLDRALAERAPQVHQAVMVEQQGLLGTYRAVDDRRLAAAPPEAAREVERTRAEVKQQALFQVAALPLLMLAVYLALAWWFRRRGGYRPVAVG